MNPVEHDSCFLAAPCCGKGFNQPERTDYKSYRRLAETVVQAVALQPAAVDQIFVDRVDRSEQPRISGWEKAQADHLQQRGVQVFPTVVADEALSLRAPGLGHNIGANPLGRFPELGGIRRRVAI